MDQVEQPPGRSLQADHSHLDRILPFPSAKIGPVHLIADQPLQGLGEALRHLARISQKLILVCLQPTKTIADDDPGAWCIGAIGAGAMRQ